MRPATAAEKESYTALDIFWATPFAPATASEILRCFARLVPEFARTVPAYPMPAWLRMLFFNVVVLRSLILLHRHPNKFRHVVGLLSPPWHEGLFMHSGPLQRQALQQIRRTICSQGPGGIVYALFSPTCFYIGKCKTERKTGPGFFERLREHVRGANASTGPMSAIPRYKALRKSGLAKFCMVPLVFVPTEARAYAVETTLIRMVKPAQNVAGHEVLPRVARPARKRPPKYLRDAAAPPKTIPQSVWKDPSVVLLSYRHAARFDDHQVVKKPFVQAYRDVQRDIHAVSGQVGPLCLYAFPGLLIAFAAAPEGLVWIPKNWTRARIAQLLFPVYRMLPYLGFGSREKARKRLDQALVRRQLPPSRLPLVRLPAQPGSASYATLVRSIVKHVALQHPVPAARVWILQQVKFCPLPLSRWTDKINVHSAISRFVQQSLLEVPDNLLRDLAQGKGMQKSFLCWRLPAWGDTARTQETVTTIIAKWARAVFAPDRLLASACRRLQCTKIRVEANKDIPEQWHSAEIELRNFCDSHQLLVGDDKNKSAVWGSPALTVHAIMLSHLLRDSHTWMRVELPRELIASHVLACSLHGLPKRLRKNLRQLPEPPSLFPLIKSKCFDATGTKVCTKPLHSCIRRVVSHAGTAWKNLGSPREEQRREL